MSKKSGSNFKDAVLLLRHDITNWFWEFISHPQDPCFCSCNLMQHILHEWDVPYKRAAQYIGNPLRSLIFCHAKLSLQSKLLSMSLKPCTVAGMNENLFDLSGNQLHISRSNGAEALAASDRKKAMDGLLEESSQTAESPFWWVYHGMSTLSRERKQGSLTMLRWLCKIW